VWPRFTQHYTWRELYELYRLTCSPVNIEPRYNIAPTTMIDVVVPHEARPRAAVETRELRR
jgi:putative SOS response-associated peptidase YedK